MTTDPFGAFKAKQREMWASFAPTAIFTTPPAAKLVAFAGIKPGERVLDVASGTGVVAITAARVGAKVSAIDLTPELVAEARANGRLAGAEVAWHDGDAEHLPFPDASFDVVVSQFGHMFAPRPEVAISEMRRVIASGGRVAFSTWPPDKFVGQIFALVGRNGPPPPPGVQPPGLWGDPNVVRQRLGEHFAEPAFARDVMWVPALSPAHLRTVLERSVGPIQKLTEALASDPARLAAFRAELESLTIPYYADNLVRQDFLMTKANVR